MSKFSEYIGSQFSYPRGLIGMICCLIMNLMNRKMYEKVISHILLRSEDNVLDIGYGNGYLIHKIVKGGNPNIYGIDISEDMRSIASKKNNKGIQSGKIKLLIGDCCNLDFSDKVFRAATSVNTIYFWEDTLKGLKEINRVLKEGAIFYNAVYSKEWLEKLSYTQKGFHLFEKEEYIQLGKAAGFSEVVITDIQKGKSYLIQYKKTIG